MPENPELARESKGPSSGVLTVSALNRSVRDLLEHRYPLLWVGGEISNFVLARSGHCYFVLKDAQAQVRCVMFRNRNMHLEWQPKDGMQVEAQALVTMYEARGEFQLTIESMRRAGSGALYEQFLRLRDKLASEGLFSEDSKRPLPSHPQTIGIVTSLKAAAMRDILTTLARRNPAINVVIYPVPVQGAGAGAKIAAALRTAGMRAECDVLILARGGGSIEDLWAFNEEVVARAIRACPIPVVSGVGHETDFTITDFAADRRAPTPTAAAELTSPDRVALLHRVEMMAHRLSQRTLRDVQGRMQRLDAASRRLEHPGQRLQAQLDRLRQLRERLGRSMGDSLGDLGWRLAGLLHRGRALLPAPAEQRAHVSALATRLRIAMDGTVGNGGLRLASLATSLEHLNPERVLERGYSLVRDASGRVVMRGDALSPGDALDIRFAQGGAKVRVDQSH